MAPLDVEIVTGGDNPGLVALLSNADDGWPTGRWDEATDTEEEVDVAELVAAHLDDGWVAVLLEAGHEKLRYLVGHATAINAAGETRQIRLDEIYELAGQLGPHLTRAEW